MKTRSRGYDALRVYVRFAFWLTHKKIVVVGKEKIPMDAPLIFAANHQNALMDPLALVCTNPLQTLWLARADIFKSKAAKPVLKFMKMIPIYRIRDGKDNLLNNEQIFNQVAEVLENKESVALFPEAAHSGKRRMLQHKKAIPRIALDAEEKNQFELGLQIVPVGIYYDHYWNFNRTLIVQYGESIGVDAYKDRFRENSQNAMLVLRDEIHDCLEPLTLQINSEKYYLDYENIRMVAGGEYSNRKFFDKEPLMQLLKAEQELIVKIEQLEAERTEAFEMLLQRTENYTKEIAKAGYTDRQINSASKVSFFKLLFQLVGALCSLPVFAFGFLFSFIPFLIPRVFLTKKVKDPAFLSTFIFVAGLILFPVFYLIEFGIVWLVSGSLLIAFSTLVLMPFAGKFAFQLMKFYGNVIQTIKLKTVHAKLFRKLKTKRADLLNFLFQQIS